MSEEKKPVTVSEMLRYTASNTNDLFLKVANHIDKLEEQLVKLEKRILELESEQDANR
jgi:GTPase SAR1 family protein